MIKTFSVFISLFLLSSCQNLYLGQVEILQVKDLKEGMKTEEIVKHLGAPISIHKFPSPSDFNKITVVYQYENLVEEYMNKGPFWIIFEDNSLMTHGLGDTRYAEFIWHSAFFDFQRINNKIKFSDAERSRYQKMKQLYKLTSYEDEYFTYRIVVAGKLERGEIDSDNYNYLIAQKKSDIDSKLDVVRNNSIAIAQTNELISLQRAALIMQSMRPLGNTTKYTNCSSTQFGRTWYTNCY